MRYNASACCEVVMGRHKGTRSSKKKRARQAAGRRKKKRDQEKRWAKNRTKRMQTNGDGEGMWMVWRGDGTSGAFSRRERCAHARERVSESYDCVGAAHVLLYCDSSSMQVLSFRCRGVLVYTRSPEMLSGSFLCAPRCYLRRSERPYVLGRAGPRARLLLSGGAQTFSMCDKSKSIGASLSLACSNKIGRRL